MRKSLLGKLKIVMHIATSVLNGESCRMQTRQAVQLDEDTAMDVDGEELTENR